ncbi:hypothetical protein ACN42_g2791, partial [Penicillium freii]
IRYGVVANIAVSHTAAGGSIPPIGVSFSFFISSYKNNCLFGLAMSFWMFFCMTF